jgi:hypothetical protein
MTNEELVAFVKRNPISVGCGVLSVLLAVAIYFRSGSLPAAEATLAEKSAEADRYAANISHSKELKEQFDALVAANKEIDSRLVRASQLGINSQYFYQLERETGVKLLDSRPGIVPKGAKTTFVPVPFNVAAQGSLTQLFQFLYYLESGARYSRVLNATFATSGNNRSDPLTLSLSIELLGLP